MLFYLLLGLYHGHCAHHLEGDKLSSGWPLQVESFYCALDEYSSEKMQKDQVQMCSRQVYLQ